MTSRRYMKEDEIDKFQESWIKRMRKIFMRVTIVRATLTKTKMFRKMTVIRATKLIRAMTMRTTQTWLSPFMIQIMMRSIY